MEFLMNLQRKSEIRRNYWKYEKARIWPNQIPNLAESQIEDELNPNFYELNPNLANFQIGQNPYLAESEIWGAKCTNIVLNET